MSGQPQGGGGGGYDEMIQPSRCCLTKLNCANSSRPWFVALADVLCSRSCVLRVSPVDHLGDLQPASESPLPRLRGYGSRWFGAAAYVRVYLLDAAVILKCREIERIETRLNGGLLLVVWHTEPLSI